MIQTEQLQHGCMEVMDMDWMIDSLKAKRVCATKGKSTTHPATCHPDRKAFIVVVTAIPVLRSRRPAKLARPDHKRRI